MIHPVTVAVAVSLGSVLLHRIGKDCDVDGGLRQASPSEHANMRTCKQIVLSSMERETTQGDATVPKKGSKPR